jgi:hypothetical protein
MIKSLKNIYENFEDIANDIQTIKLDNSEYIVLKKTTKNTNAVINALSTDNSDDLYTNNILNSKNSINNDIKPKTETKKTDTKTETKKTDTNTETKKTEDTTTSSEKTSSSTKLMWVLFGLGLFILVIIIIMFIRYLMTRNNSNSTEQQSINQINDTTDINPTNLQSLTNEPPIKNNIEDNVNVNKSQSSYKIPSKPSSYNDNANDTVIETIKTPESLSISQRTKELLKTYSPQNDNTDNKSKSFSSLFSFSKNSKPDDINKIDNVVNSRVDNDGNDGNDDTKDINNDIKKVGGKKYNYKKTTNTIKYKRPYIKRKK